MQSNKIAGSENEEGSCLKMKTSTDTDYFDMAMKNTFAKTSRISYTSLSNFGDSDEETGDKVEVMDYSLIVNLEYSTSPNIADKENEISYAPKAIEELENLRRIKLKDSINERVRKMNLYEDELRSRMNANLLLTKEEINIKDRLRWKMSESSISDDDLTTSRKFSALLKRYLDQKSTEENISLKQKNTDEEIARKNEIKKIKTDYSVLQDKMMKDMTKCKSCPKLLVLATDELRKTQEFSITLKNILLKTETRISDNDIETGRMILDWLSLLADNIREKIEQINEEDTEQDSKPLTKKNDSPDVEKVSKEKVAPDSEADYVSRESVEFYSKLNESFNKVSKQVDEFLKNTSSKNFIRNLKIAINTPINALSSLNAAHIQDKFRKISDLLRGRFSFPTTDVSPSTKSLYYPFLIDFMSKKFISQGENMLIPSKPEDAFILASLIVALWIDFPDFGPVFLTQLMKRCPYTIPAYWPQYKSQSEKDFYVSRGYQYKQDGTIEDQNSFLKRMTGIFMLYVAIVVSVPRRNQQHPHGLQYAWRWVSATVNLDPRPDITAALLYVFLDMAGHKLSQHYRKQFWKIVQFVISDYLMKIEKVTSDDFRGPVSRLNEYLTKVIHDRRFVEPKGILPANYW